MTDTKTVYISIGNSDDKLPQAAWSEYYNDIDNCIRFGAPFMGTPKVHGAWTSETTSAWQNACWCVELTPALEKRLRLNLPLLAHTYGQDSIAWAEATTEFIKAAS